MQMTMPPVTIGWLLGLLVLILALVLIVVGQVPIVIGALIAALALARLL